jgi:hypothetical protein
MSDFFQGFTKNMFNNSQAEDWSNKDKMKDNFKMTANTTKVLLEYGNKMINHQLNVANKFAHSCLEMCENILHSKNLEEAREHNQNSTKKQVDSFIRNSEEMMEMQKEAYHQLNKLMNPVAENIKPATAAKGA